jgi:HAD superfamily hydrolase (TIGR01509 family)
MLKAVILDMDGVIIDSEPFHREVCRRIFKSLGIDVPEEEYFRYIGVSNTNMWTAIKRTYRLNQSVNKLVAMQVFGNMEFMKKERVDPVDGIFELLSGLQEAGFLIGLASSSPHQIIEMVLDAFNIKQYFDCVVSGADFENGKPAPDIFLKAAAMLNVLPEQCVVVEDATHGVHAAKAARMKCIGFINVNSAGQDLCKADLIIHDLKALDIHNVLSLA